MARGRGKLTPRDLEYMKIISNNISKLIKECNYKQIDLSKSTGIPPTTLSGYISGTSLPIAGNVQKIADFFHVQKSDIDPRFDTNDVAQSSNTTISEIKDVVLNLNTHRQQVVLDIVKAQLKEQQEEEKKTAVKEATTEYKVKKKIPVYKIDVVEKLAAGYGHYLADIPQEYTAYIRENPSTLPDYDFASIVDGYSMTPNYDDGDIVLIKQGYDFQDGNVYAVVLDDETFLKKVYFKKNEIILQSINIEYKDIHIPICDDRVDIRIIGKVIGQLTPLKIISKD